MLALDAELFWVASYRVSIGFIESLEAVLSFFLNSKLESPFAALTGRNIKIREPVCGDDYKCLGSGVNLGGRLQRVGRDFWIKNNG